MTPRPTLTGITAAVAGIRDLPAAERVAQARQLIPDLDAVLDHQIQTETVVRLWRQLAQNATGTHLDVDNDDREGTRAGAIATLQDPPRRRPGRPSLHNEPVVDLRLRLPESLHKRIVTEAEQSGLSLNGYIINRLTP